MKKLCWVRLVASCSKHRGPEGPLWLFSVKSHDLVSEIPWADRKRIIFYSVVGFKSYLQMVEENFINQLLLAGQRLGVSAISHPDLHLKAQA